MNKSLQDISLVQHITAGALHFALKLNKLLYEGTTKNQTNFLFSPINIYSTLALVHLGADGKSADELANLLALPEGGDKVQKAHYLLTLILQSIPITEHAVIRIANGIFIQKDVALNSSYMFRVKNHYKGKISNLDFQNNAEEATNYINNFVSKRTSGKIPQLFEDPLPRETGLVLATCSYFKATWYKQFDDATEENFNTPSGNVTVKMMTSRRYIPHVNFVDLKFEAISLGYGPVGLKRHDLTPDSPHPPEVSMYFILPYQNYTLDDLISSLDSAAYEQIVDQTQTTYVQVKIPKFSYKWSSNINNFLKLLGIDEIFTENAHLNNMVAKGKLKLSQVTHAAQIEVDEKGTEASAATIYPLVHTRLETPLEPILFHVNRPFLTFIYHHKTEMILFMGAVHNPNTV